jgi:hypothetical protein
MMDCGALGEFAMPSLRLGRRLTLTSLVLLLVMNGAALADPHGAILNAEKSSGRGPDHSAIGTSRLEARN